MSNHSPGPWFVGAQNDALFVIDRPPQHFTDNPLPEGGLTITIAAVAMLKHPIADANARLISAAPTLLEACISARDVLISWIESEDCIDDRRFIPVLNSITNAIQKAEGPS